MNMRIYKKKAKRAREILIRDFGYSRRQFCTVQKEDELGWEFFGDSKAPNPLNGTPILVRNGCPSYDFSVECCLRELSEAQFWSVSREQLNRRFAALGENIGRTS